MSLYSYEDDCFSGWNPVCLVDIEADLLVKESQGSQHRFERFLRGLMVIVFSSPNSCVNK